jgi:hypothetical protein
VTPIRGALLAIIILSAGCGSAESGPSVPYLGTLDPIIYVGQLAPTAQLVTTLDGRPLPSPLTLRIDSGDVAAFTVNGSSLQATQPGAIYMTVTHTPSGNAALVHVGAIFDTRGRWLFHNECPWVGDSTHSPWETVTLQSDYADYQASDKPAWINGVIAGAQTVALGTTIDSTITVHYQGGAVVQVDTSTQISTSAIAVSSKSAPIRIDIPRPTYPFLEVGFPTASGPGGLHLLPLISANPLLAGDNGQTFCGGVFSSDPTLARSSLSQLRAVP